MTGQRLKDIAIGFLLCLALVVSYHCGASNPTNANASTSSSNYATVGGAFEGSDLGYVVIDQNTGKVVFSELISEGALGTDANYTVNRSERYW